MSGFLEDIRRLLIDAGLVEGTSGWKCALGYMPPSPDQMVGLFRYAGNPPDSRNESEQCEYPGLQVRVRAAEFNFAAADQKAEAIRNFLHTCDGLVFEGRTYPWIEAVQSPFTVGNDESDRPEMLCNYIVAREMRAAA